MGLARVTRQGGILTSRTREGPHRLPSVQRSMPADYSSEVEWLNDGTRVGRTIAEARVQHGRVGEG